MLVSTMANANADPPAQEAQLVCIRGLRKSFDGRVVLDRVDMDVPKGSIVSIIGQSGGGKTTLMRCVNLLELPDDGSISIDKQPIFSEGRVVCRDLARLRQQVGMVFQRFNLFPHLTAVENVVLAQMHAARVAERRAVERAVELLTTVGLRHRAMAYPEQMSGGEQQRVAIARARAGTRRAAVRRTHVRPRSRVDRRRSAGHAQAGERRHDYDPGDTRTAICT
jgi:ABC-type polar amino acid transport system ATPase subunit